MPGDGWEQPPAHAGGSAHGCAGQAPGEQDSPPAGFGGQEGGMSPM